jgi:hypothetical protein
MHRYTRIMLKTIHSIHNDIPHEWHRNPTARHYQYYPSFLIWVHDKSYAELQSRKLVNVHSIGDELRTLRSRSIASFLPPSDIEIADDVVYLLDTWKDGRPDGGNPIPYSYLELAQQIYGYNANKASLEGVGEIPGPHRDSDGGWYHIQGQT